MSDPNAASAPPGVLPASLRRNPRLSSWLRVDRAGTVTVRTGKVELGQGIVTALAQIVAEELDIALARVRMAAADTVDSPDEGTTTGSLSVADSGSALRAAAAEARRLLLARAAKRLGVDVASLVVIDGAVSTGRGDCVTYWEIADDALLDCDVDGGTAPKTPDRYRIVGSSAPRIDLPGKITGQRSYVHDMALPGMLFGRVVRPPRPGARLAAVDATRVAALPGDVRVVRDGSFLGLVAAREEVAVKGRALLAADSAWNGGDAPPPEPRELYAYLRERAAEPVLVVDRAGSRPGSRKLSATYTKPYLSHASIGPSCAVARWDADALTVWSHTQGIFTLRHDLALALRVANASITVRHVEGSGCYGHNGADDVALDAALLARAVPGRAVKALWSREDEFGWAPVGPAMVVSLQASLDDAGRIAEWQTELWGNGHGSRPTTGCTEDGAPTPALLAAWYLEPPFVRPAAVNPLPPTYGAERNAVPIYAIPARVVYRYVRDEPLRPSALRTLGAYGNVFAIESFMDELADAAGIDAVAFRLRHLDDARARAVVEAAATRAGWQPGARRSRNQGIGFARYKNHGAYCAVVADVEIEREVRVTRLVCAVDVGLVINPDGVANQIEGGAVQATSWTLKEEVRFGPDGVTSVDWDRYPILKFSEAPAVDVVMIDRPDQPSVGAGEAVAGPVAAAIANAIAAKLGVRARDLPLTATNIERAMA